MKLKSFLLVGAKALFFSSLTAYAGGDTSGGGNAVVCFDDPSIPAQIRNTQNPFFGELLDSFIPHVTSIEAYDLAQAKLPRGWAKQSPVLFEPLANEAPNDYVERLAQRFEKAIPALAKFLRNGKERFQDANVIAEPHGLTKVNDIGEVGNIDSVNCVVATLAAQYNTGDKFSVHYDSRLFTSDRHSSFSQNVLVSHEYLYSEARLNGQSTSRNTRDLLGLMITLSPNTTVQQLVDAAYDLGFLGSKRELRQDYVYASQITQGIAWRSLNSAYKTYRENIIENQDTLEKFEKFSIRTHEFLDRVREAIDPKHPENAFSRDPRLNDLLRLASYQYGIFVNSSYDRYEYALTHALQYKQISDKLYREGQGLLTTLRALGSKYYAPIWFNMLKEFNEKGRSEIDAIPFLPTAEKEKLKQNEFGFMAAIYDILLGKEEQVRKDHFVYGSILAPEHIESSLLSTEYDYRGEKADSYNRWTLIATIYNPSEKDRSLYTSAQLSRMAQAFTRYRGPDLNYTIP